MDLYERLKAAQEAARKAGRLILSSRDFTVHAKALHDYVTETDAASERLIREYLLSRFPGDDFFGEEGGGSNESTGRWIVDPIDGTNDYIRNIPMYSVSIAYERMGQIVLGVVYAPALDEMYTAVRGEGACLNGERIRVSPMSDPGTAAFGFSANVRYPGMHDTTVRILSDLLLTCGDLRRFGSAAYELCQVACGRIEGFFEYGLHIYDIAAGVLILTEAGGSARGWSPEEDVLKTCSICASNGILQDYLSGIVHL